MSSAVYLVFYFMERKKPPIGPPDSSTKVGQTIGNGDEGNGHTVNPPVVVSPPPTSVTPPVRSADAVPPITVDGSTEFVKNEAAYQEWLKQHPQGFVVNTLARAEDKAKCVILHKAGCGSIRYYKGRVTPGAYTEREYSKICANDIASLARWAVRIGRIGEPFSGVCGLCKPPVPATPPEPSHSVASLMPTAHTAPQSVVPQITSWTPQEFALLLVRCRALPPARGNYIIDDYVENVLLTVLDFMLNTTTVENAAKHYKKG